MFLCGQEHPINATVTCRSAENLTNRESASSQNNMESLGYRGPDCQVVCPTAARFHTRIPDITVRPGPLLSSKTDIPVIDNPFRKASTAESILG